MPVLFYVYVYTFAFLFGITIGSFLNVCIYRIPAKESLIPSSHCMSCGHKLSWRDLFPVFSYLLLKGRCRYCGAKISCQYSIVELANGVLYVIVFMANGISFTSVIFCLMTSALIVLSVIDERTFEIPFGINIFLFVLGVVATIVDYSNWSEHLIGLFCVSLPLYLLYVITKGAAIGGGDIKLMAVCGLVLGWKCILLAFFVGCVLGSVIHIARMKITKADHMLAMGPYLSMGVFLCALWGNQWIAMYLNCIGLN